MIKTTLAFGVLVWAASAYAQSECQGYTGQSVAAVTFDQALKGLPSVAPRGEYETTAQYEARRNAETGEVGTIIILKEPEDRDRHIRYDADTGRLYIHAYAFDNTNFEPWRAFYDTPAGKSLDADVISNVDVVISQSKTTKGTYEGQNAYGARWTVNAITRTTQAIFDRRLMPSEGFSVNLFHTTHGPSSVVGSLNLSPEEAQRIKPLMQLAFVVLPRYPYVVRNTYKGRGRVTIQNPFDITEVTTVLIGDIQCALALDNQNKVLGSFPTR
jgi:hypothetical protein